MRITILAMAVVCGFGACGGGDDAPTGTDGSVIDARMVDARVVDAATDAAIDAAIDGPPPPPTLAIAATATLGEGNAGTMTGMVEVTLSAAQPRPVTVRYESNAGTATALVDYVDVSGTLTFAPGATSAMIPLEATGDTLDEDDETFTLTLSVPQGATLMTATSTVTISDDDAPPALDVAPVTAAEGAPRGLGFVVRLSTASARPVTVSYATAAGTASAADFTGATGMVQFLPGETAKPVAIAPINDALDEPDETMTLTLSAPVNATILTADATGTITDDDLTPSLAIGDAIVVEGNAGTTTASFPVTLSGPSGNPVTVMYGTTAGSATAGSDYTTAAGTLTLPAGATGGMIDVTVNGDGASEADETFTITLSAATNATITAPATASGTILDDDAGLPTLMIGDATTVEGNAGTSALAFAVTLSQAAAGNVTVGFATADRTATDGPGVGGGDYTALAGTLTFAPGTLTRTITIPVIGDVHDEANETLAVVLSAASNAMIADAEGLGTITDDDGTPMLASGPVTVAESTATAVFTVSLSAASGRPVTVGYTTADGTATAGGSATTGGQDFVGRSGTLTFAPGETAKTVAVAINGDLLDEADETFGFTLAGAVNATVATASVVGTITDDDATPTLAIADLALLEGTEATSVAVVPVTLSAASGRTVTVQVATGDAPAPTAAPGTDYTAASGTLTFAPGVTTQLVTVTLLADTTDEPFERFVVDLAGATNAVIGDAQGLVTIADDDSALPDLSIGNAPTVTEAAGNVMMTFTVTLGSASPTPVTVSYAAGSTGTATTGTDFTVVPGMLTFTPGQTAKPIVVTIPSDVYDEPTETVVVNLSGNSANSNLLDAQGQGVILDNDAAPALAAANTTVTEGNGVVSTATFTVTLTPVSGQAVTVGYTTGDGTASAATGLGLDDYETRSGTLTFPPGIVSRTITVPVAGDRVVEPNETFVLDFASPVNATMATTTATATITNDDAVPTLAIAAIDVGEGPAGLLSPLVFPITMSAPSLVPVTVVFNTVNGTATAGSDYVAQTSTVTFAPGTTAANRTVRVTGDAVVEPNETVTGRLSGPTNATLTTATATGTIVNDD